jgi:hypothetical protein
MYFFKLIYVLFVYSGIMITSFLYKLLLLAFESEKIIDISRK